MKKLLLVILVAILFLGTAHAAVGSDVALVEDTEGEINKTIGYPLDTYSRRRLVRYTTNTSTFMMQYSSSQRHLT